MKYLPTCDVHAAQPVIGFRPRISHLANLCPIFCTFQEQEIGNFNCVALPSNLTCLKLTYPLELLGDLWLCIIGRG